MALAVRYGALLLAVPVEPFEDVLCMPAMLALLAPDKPHLEVATAHVQGDSGRLVLQELGLFLMLHLVVEDPDVLQADGAGGDGFAALADTCDQLDVLLVQVHHCLALVDEALHLLLNGVGGTTQVAATGKLIGLFVYRICREAIPVAVRNIFDLLVLFVFLATIHLWDD